MKTGIELIAEERIRQVEVEGWTAEHDKKHVLDEMARLAALYAIPDRLRYLHMTDALYPRTWDGKWYKPTPENRVRELQKAGALIAAEIDRLQAQGDFHEKIPF